MATTTQKLDIFTNLLNVTASKVNVTAHHRAYVRECRESGDLDARDELQGAAILALETGAAELSALFGGMLAMVDGYGRGNFPAGIWNERVAEVAFAFVNTYYTDLAEQERKGTCLDWSNFTN